MRGDLISPHAGTLLWSLLSWCVSCTDSIGALHFLWLGVLEFVLVFCLGKGHGKLPGKLATDTIGYRATNICAKNTGKILKKKGKIQMASMTPGSHRNHNQLLQRHPETWAWLLMARADGEVFSSSIPTSVFGKEKAGIQFLTSEHINLNSWGWQQKRTAFIMCYFAAGISAPGKEGSPPWCCGRVVWG